jgi:superfamily II DNA or RNA helicase
LGALTPLLYLDILEGWMTSAFQTRRPNVAGNTAVRVPQQEAYDALAAFAAEQPPRDREVGIVLPVGCGKSGCIALAPFAFRSRRALVIAPGITIAQQLHKDFDPSNPGAFYIKCGVLNGAPYPEPAEIRGTTTNRSDLDDAEVVITNIHQLQGAENRWLQDLPADFFDLILFDEGHHSVAATWDTLKQKFPLAKIVNFSATPLRADGDLMAGRILYSYPVFRAIQQGYVKRLKAVVLNPSTLRYVRQEDGQEIEVTLDEVRRLGEEDAGFRRSIVTSTETLNTIVDASIRELQRLRTASGEQRLKIIAAALNFEHCGQIVQAYRARGLKADFVHSREDTAGNKKVIERLEAHQLDVIVQVTKLGEGFDHPHLAVAAVFKIFANLSPFVQFVGRIMRVIKQNAPDDPLNRGVVVFHAGSNVASRWEDFQQYSEADREYFDQLLPLEGLDFDNAGEIEVEPRSDGVADGVEIRSQSGVSLEEIPLISDDAEAMAAVRLLRERGYSTEQVTQALRELDPVPVTKQRQRQAARLGLEQRVQNAAGQILAQRRLSHEGRQLDRQHLGRTNFVVMKSAIDKAIKRARGKDRPNLDREDLAWIDENFDALVTAATGEVFDGTS